MVLAQRMQTRMAFHENTPWLIDGAAPRPYENTISLWVGPSGPTKIITQERPLGPEASGPKESACPLQFATDTWRTYGARNSVASRPSPYRLGYVVLRLRRCGFVVVDFWNFSTIIRRL